MTDVDAIKEAADAKEWEDLNRDDPKAQKAAQLLTDAVKLLEQAETLIAQAAETVEFTPEAARTESLHMDAEDLEIAIRLQIGRLK